jgi:hypothetical protein
MGFVFGALSKTLARSVLASCFSESPVDADAIVNLVGSEVE